MKRQKLILCNSVLTLLYFSLTACAQNVSFTDFKGPYFGQTSPGDTPEVFAPDLMTAEGGYHGTVVFSSDGKEAYWTPMKGGWGVILSSRYENNSWTTPKRESFGLKGNVSEPAMAPDGNRIFFLSSEPVDGETKKRRRIWYCDRTVDGWSKAKLVSESVYKHPTHWSFSVAQNGNLYFISEINEEKSGADIYMSKYDGQKYLKPELLGSGVNTDLMDHTPFIAPDESYLIFSRGTNSGGGLFISYKTKSGDWTEAINMGSNINFGKVNLSPKVSPDGKYLFYIGYKPDDKFRIYWVDAKIIEKLKSKN